MDSNSLIDGYARGKLCELVHELFIGMAPAREKLSDHLHFVFVISPSDFRLDEHQIAWARLQDRLLGKTKNIGTKRAPIDRLTVRNGTLVLALETIWGVYSDCVVGERQRVNG